MIRTEFGGLDINTEKKEFTSAEELKEYIASTGYPIKHTEDLFEVLAGNDSVDWLMMYPNEYKSIHIWREARA